MTVQIALITIVVDYNKIRLATEFAREVNIALYKAGIVKHATGFITWVTKNGDDWINKKFISTNPIGDLHPTNSNLQAELSIRFSQLSFIPPKGLFSHTGQNLEHPEQVLAKHDMNVFTLLGEDLGFGEELGFSICSQPHFCNAAIALMTGFKYDLMSGSLLVSVEQVKGNTAAHLIIRDYLSKSDHKNVRDIAKEFLRCFPTKK